MHSYCIHILASILLAISAGEVCYSTYGMYGMYVMLDSEESGQCEAVRCIRTYLGIGLLAGRKKI